MAISTELSNLDRLKRAYCRWISSHGADPSMLLALMADNIQYVSGGERPQRPEYFRMHTSKQSMEQYFEDLFRDWKMLTYQPEEFVCQGSTIAMRGQCAFEYRATGRVCETIEINWWHFEGESAVSLYHAFDTAAMVACMAP